MSNGIGHVWAVNAEGGDEGRPNGVGPVWIENADQLGSKLPEPEAGDAGKVLGVLNADGDLGWVVDQGGMAQVQSDWDQTDPSQVSYIANKPNLATVATSGAYSDLSGTPTIPTVDQVYDATSANAQSGVAVASALSGKQDTISDLETIRSGASAGATAVQPAALNDYATTSALTTGLASKQDTISDLETIRSGAEAGSTAVQPGDLATVATSGSYADLSNKPSIPAAQVNSDWNAVSGVEQILNKPNLATVATTGSYNDLQDKPTIPSAVTVDQHYDALSANPQSGTAVAEAIAGTGQVPTVTSADDNKVLMASYSGGVGSFSWEPSAAATQVNADWTATSGVAEILNKPDLSVYAQSANLATVATSGNYNDLSNRPSIPAAQVNADWDAASGVAQILNKPVLATVATSGSYNDLSNKPTIPAAQVNSDWNESSSSSKAFILNKPDLSIYAQSANLATVATSGSYNDLSNKPTIPSTKPLVAGNNITITENANDVTIAASGTSYSAGTGISISNGTISADTTILATQTDLSAYTPTASLATVATTGAYSDLSGTPTISNVPAVTSSDDDKVLKASYSGGVGSYAWESEPVILGLTAGSNVTITEANNAVTIAATDTTYTAGNMIAIDSNNSNAIGVSTTAGITDIQLVNALPASPVATVLYIIPET